MLAFEVEDLAANHAFDGAGGFGDEADDADGAVGLCSELGENLVGKGLERVAGKDGGGFSEGDVAGGLAAAEVVVVERGEIVVDERVGVEHFDRCAQVCDAVGKSSGVRMDGVMVRAASMARTGRRRLPPAKTEWRMAPWIEAGTWVTGGRRRSRARSVRSTPSRRIS